MSFKGVARSLADYLTTTLPHPLLQQEVIAYGLELLFLGAAGFMAVTLAGFLIGAPAETLMALIVASLLRVPGGGIHLSTPTRCLLFSVAVFSLLGFLCHRFGGYPLINTYLIYLIIGSGFFSLIASFLWAPSNPSKPIVSTGLRRKLRRIAIIVSVFAPLILVFVLAWRPSLALAGASGLAWQSINIFLAGKVQTREVKA